ncbi:UDP-4-amino-4,6-dideoxy-N-acetyl-beta-L-altrosamine transaminase [Eggerthella sp. YY7918]|uniref:UDP-4-amino-4, 6-dideoxy-N-acetyl-beta-L-altrosamine transaminase n=1 Tax=Eggerthella sp. (strain YY7918) TaxID=502558 RepID=UPI0002171125|nr:UDP-4-amino-4,6-dideoxy-N-acetyl-beta-L-altrosamine transaminase [Eggerthella sp. YY7918]BAK44099.1 predicted pyridoxal phosphate-dependent enzyme apparently involved in regulation of cell wall biogen [Eggerthella sp. YY7918]
MDALAIDGGKPVSGHLIGYGHQDISDRDIQAVVKTLRSDYLTCGPATEAFEAGLRLATGAKFVAAVANGTAALHVACLAAGIGSGDEVIVSSITFAASANCVLYCGGIPVFADIDPYTWNISSKSIREKITSKTRAIVAVDFGGVHVDSEEIRKICDEHNLIFIEDAAHAIGTSHGGRQVGSIADITTFSFHPVKTITTGEGGAVATNDPVLAARVELFAKHGITRDASLFHNPDEGGWYYEQLELGYNYRMSDIQAALGLSQLERLDDFSARRREIVSIYNSEFSKIPEVSFQKDTTPEETTRHLYVLRFDVESLGVNRKYVFDALRAENIGVNVHYLPVYRLPYYAFLGYNSDCCIEANHYYEEAVTLPLHCCLTNEEVEHVIGGVKKVVEHCKDGGRRISR